ncbi:MAG TPA: anthranilate phosphoribosyltransferase [Bacteroidales bacterium]|nr:anthranilate phosphoribosyltransferase [Bacteroidales bacterium]HRR93459.1 anthranilate phosphoribosyltransferase [Bacteroidales bacterium]HRT89507.1 anthranilate phosphoribosyltransferase [Bacteroidales bacterium]
MKKILNYLFEHKTLSRSEAEEVMINIAGGKYSETEIAAFITVYLMRSITVEELSGFRNALLNLCNRVNLSDFDTIDVCGTGGDNKETFNISTLTAFVLAGAGVKVAKHGNYGVTSACGSSNILEHFGYRFSTDPGKLKRELGESGICFLHAPLFNPAMKTVAPVRKALKVKTFFNMLGPTVNPSSPKRQMIGVYSLEIARLYNYMYQESDINYAIVHSLDGYDEVSLTSSFRYIFNGTEQILDPETISYQKVLPADLAGGKSVKESAEIFIGILEGRGTTARNSTVLANSQIALRCCFPGKSLDECREMAEDSLFNGKALKSFKRLMEIQ